MLAGREHSVKHIYFSHSWIIQIENGTFDAFDKLQVLSFHSNNLTTLDDGVLTEKLGSTLVSLDFGSNPIKYVSAATFKNLHKLEHLRFDSMPAIAPYFHSGIFPASLRNLKVLILYHNNISFFDDDIFANLT